MHGLNFHHYLWICSLLRDYVMFCFKSLLYMCFRRFVLNYAIPNCVVWHGCKSNCRPLSLPVASFKDDYKNLVTGPCSRQYSWQQNFHLVTARKKGCLTWGSWKWSLMRALTDYVQSFWGSVCDSTYNCWKASLLLLPPPSLLASSCLVNPNVLIEESLTQPWNSRAQSSSTLIADLSL